jgi:signal transduction histidine kinase
MFRHSLRTRVVFAFGLFAALLGITSGFGILATMRVAEDRMVERQLRLSVTDYIGRSGVDPDVAPPHSAYLKSYREPVDLPTALRDWAADTPDDGYYEFQSDELHVAVVTTGVPPRPLYVVADVSGIEASATEEVWWIIGLVTIFSMLTMLAIALGTFISRRAIDPVIRLAEAVGSINSEQLSDDDWRRVKAASFDDDEVGLLARTIEKTLKRICAFIDRERYFTSSASHELRTPITVIKGALELLEQAEMSRNASRAVGRIERAAIDMQARRTSFGRRPFCRTSARSSRWPTAWSCATFRPRRPGTGASCPGCWNRPPGSSRPEPTRSSSSTPSTRRATPGSPPVSTPSACHPPCRPGS